MATQLFSDIPTSAKSIPGSVTPNISADIQQTLSASDQATLYALQRRMWEDSRNDWARAAAINAANAPQHQDHYLPGTETQSNPQAYQRAQGKGAVLWAPRNMTSGQLGTWSDQQQKQAMAENRTPPIILQAHTDQPYSPGEVGGGVSQNEIGKTLFGPGLSTPMGLSNPAKYAQWLAGR